MKARPILYSKEMILAKKAGRKTVTRRPLKDSYVFNHDPDRYKTYGINDESEALFEDLKEDKPTKWVQPVACPFGVLGDWLYVKENFQIVERNDFEQAVKVKYKADGGTRWVQLTDAEFEKYREWKQPFGKKSSLFMFKSLSRFWDKITEIDVERVQDITPEEVWNEGLRVFKNGAMLTHEYCMNLSIYEFEFEKLWQTMYKGGEFDWHQNPWVWVVRFGAVSEKAEVRSKKR